MHVFPQSSCAFHFQSGVTSGDYAVALQIEDFTDSSSTVPLSSVPLQFIITVDNNISCSSSCYLIPPTPSEGYTLQSQNGSLQFITRARVYLSHEM